MNIGIDMMGGDYAPLEAVKGVQHYLSTSQNHLFCIGDETQLKELFQQHGYNIKHSNKDKLVKIFKPHGHGQHGQ